jgi:hypothetical protein
MTVGRVSSIAANARSSALMSWPPRLASALTSVASSTRSSNPAVAAASGPAPGSRCRSSAPPQRSSRWYSSFVISSIRRRSSAPPGLANSSSSSCPYFSVITCQPAAVNMPVSLPTAVFGTIRSSDCRLRSTTHTISPSSATAGSTTVSQTAPSSNSASPSSEYWRPAAPPDASRR